jgi:hypothetical protein
MSGVNKSHCSELDSFQKTGCRRTTPNMRAIFNTGTNVTLVYGEKLFIGEILTNSKKSADLFRSGTS